MSPLRRLAAGLPAEPDRLFLWCPVAIGVGIGVYFGLADEPPPWLGAGMAAAILPAWFALRRTTAGWLLLALLLVATGFLASQLRTMSVDGPRLSRALGPAAVTGQVVEAEGVEKGFRIVLDSLTVDGLSAAETPSRVRLRLIRSDRPPLPGDRITVRAILNPLPESTLPGAFDFQRHAFFQRLGAIGFAVGPIQRLTVDGQADDPRWSVWIERLRQRLDDRLRAGFAAGEDAQQEVRSTFASALITGKRADVPADVVEAMRDAGLAHLLAISGLNFALAAGLIYVGLRALLALVPPLALRLPVKKVAAVLAMVAAFAYLLISGATVPTQRSFLMMSLALAAVLLDRLDVSMRPVAIAATAILLAFPETLVGASFQLSFAAVIALVAAYEVLAARRRSGGKPIGERPWWRLPLVYVGGVMLTTLVATIGTAPFSLYHFNQLTSYAAIANLVAVPITSFWVMPAGLIGMLAMPFGLEHLPLAVMGYGTDLIVDLAKAIASWPGAVHRVPAVPDWGLILMTAGGLWLTLWRTRWRLLGLAGIAAGLASFAFTSPPDLMITGDGRLTGIRSADGSLLVSSTRADAFVREAWQRTLAAGTVKPWPVPGRSEDGTLTCDRLGCRYAAGAYRVALPFQDSALAEDCAAANLIVSRSFVSWRLRNRACRGVTIIDRRDLRRDGGHAFRLASDGTVRIETVRERQGRRPWVVAVDDAPPRPQRRSVPSKQTDQPPLNLDPVGSEDPGLVGRIGGLERD